jgi:hypothetical protein
VYPADEIDRVNSSITLTKLSNTAIRPLATFTRVPPVTKGVPTRIEPRLKLFLAGNELTTLPGELFQLHSLTVLSLRANDFVELPPSIGQLSSLEELNIGQNQLRYLPFEMLNLFSQTSRLNTIYLHPNRFFQPKSPSDAVCKNNSESAPQLIGIAGSHRRNNHGFDSDRAHRSGNERWCVKYQGRTQIRYFNVQGVLIKGPSFPGVPDLSWGFCSANFTTNPSNSNVFSRVDSMSAEQDSDEESILTADSSDVPEPPTYRGNGISRVPSLVEVALSAATQVSQLAQGTLANYFPQEPPEHLVDMVAGTQARMESGESKCTICGRNFIIARTEWIEWWELDKVSDQPDASATPSTTSPLRQMENVRDAIESKVPFMRKGCSWRCTPGEQPLGEK